MKVPFLYVYVLGWWFAVGFCKPACSIDGLKAVLPASAAIISAVSVENGSSYGEGSSNVAYPVNPTKLPELCAVIVNVSSSETSNYRFGIFLPAQWNSRFLAVGNGGFVGGINWLDMGAGVRYGHAVVSTDTGHNSTNTELHWALNPERKKDFGYRAVHGSVQLGKLITEAYYSSPISFSYYSGSSTGGRQGLKEAQISPSSFNGMLIGAPAWYTSHLQTWTTKIASYNLPVSDPKHVSPAMFSTIGAEVIKQCDSLDGVVDGIISSPELCNFKLTPLLCDSNLSASNTSGCLTSEQATTVSHFYADYIAEGKLAFPGMEPGSESTWPVLLGGNKPNSLGDGYIQYFLLNDPAWNWTLYNDSLVWKADAEDPGNCTANDYDMTPFKKLGGKIFMFHGLSDGLVTPGSSRLFYSRVADAMGGLDQLLSWFRFFVVPGQGHVSGTAVDAPYYFAQGGSQGQLGTDTYSTPGFEDAQHDALLALMSWVENGTAIDQIVATTWTKTNDPKSGVLRQRPICHLPKKQIYRGTGDSSNPESFVCK